YGEEKLVGTGINQHQRLRGHSEALLVTVVRYGAIKGLRFKDKQIKLSEYDVVYAASTNEACGDACGQENCVAETAAHLGAKLSMLANSYRQQGADSAGGAKKMQGAHEREDEESASASEDEKADVGMASHDWMVGRDANKSTGPIPVTYLKDFAGDRWHKRY